MIRRSRSLSALSQLWDQPGTCVLVFKIDKIGWENGSSAEKACRSCKQPKFEAQHPLQPAHCCLGPALRGPVLPSGPVTLVYTWHTHAHICTYIKFLQMNLERFFFSW